MRNNLPGGCCACVASGQTAADPAITLMKSRRRMAFPRLGLRRLGRDYSRVLRSTERGSGVKLQGNNRGLSIQSLETQGRMTVEGKLAQAARHVTEGRLIVARQCALISKQKQGGFDTFDSERLLEQFERSLAIFEDHLQKIMQAAGAAE